MWNAICYYWTKRYSSWGQWETLHRPSAYSEIWRQIIIWVPHSNCRLQMNVTVKWSHQTCVWNWAAGRVLRGDIWKIMIIAYRLLRVFNLLLEAVRTPTQPFRSTESHFAQIFFSVFTNESLHGKESVDRNAVRRQLGDTISMWDVYYQPVNWRCADFLSFPFLHFVVLHNTELASQNARNTPIVNSYWTFSVKKCVLTEGVSNAWRRIPHLSRNIQDTFHLRHTRMISPNVVWVIRVKTLIAEECSHIIDNSPSPLQRDSDPLESLW